MYLYYIVGGDGQEGNYPYTSREKARQARQDEREYAVWLLEEGYGYEEGPLKEPMRIVRRDYKLIEEKVVR